MPAHLQPKLVNTDHQTLPLESLCRQLQTELGTNARGRLAPTPSGFLHLGNVRNFVLNWLLIRALGGQVGLRIDDMDPQRSQAHYVEAIFQTLDWFGFDWDFGPQSVAEQAEFSFQKQTDVLYPIAQRLHTQGLAYACDCSRKTLQDSPTYPGLCASAQKTWQAGENALRFAAHRFGYPDDLVIWRRDGLPSYQLASVYRDQQDQINLLLRGADLLASSQFQQHLAQALGGYLANTQIWHHALLTDSHGHKLSKSTGAQPQGLANSGQSPALLFPAIAVWLDLPAPDSIRKLSELYQAFGERYFCP
ncbi:MAG: hypothetical protein JXR44_09215 [Thiotrichales bacterium]|nr:hypothetical protein [Thiotrichales bacterium]